MKIWINKVVDDLPSNEFNDACIYTIKRKGRKNIYSNLVDTWLKLGYLSLDAVYEDLFIIGLSVFAIDKRTTRSGFLNKWTREMEVSIPVIELEKWEPLEQEWNKTLSFLTGDEWDIRFRKSTESYSKRNRHSSLKMNISKCDVVCLFSGGLDSFCGAINLLEKGYSPCFIGHNEYPKLRGKQQDLRDIFKEEYSNQAVNFLSFSANSRAPTKNGVKQKGSENTSRGRSLLFLCAAMTIAGLMGRETPVFIPENGFIGLNIPLTNSRKGTCSTRTTHPFFISCFSNILEKVGIHNPIKNFFAFMTKRELVDSVKDTISFRKGFMTTISCSHPCLARYNKTGSRYYPINCGYCYPCIIRKSSLLGVDINGDNYSYNDIDFDFIIANRGRDRSSDLLAVLNSVYRYKQIDEKEIRRLIKCTGKLNKSEVDKFVEVYKKTMDDLIEMFSRNSELKKYIGE